MWNFGYYSPFHKLCVHLHPNLYIMKRLSIFLLLLAVCLTVYPQKTKKNAGPTPSERMVSVEFANALRAYYTGNYETAEKAFHSVLSTQADHAAAYFMLGRMKADAVSIKKIKNINVLTFRALKEGTATVETVIHDAEYYLKQACQCDKNNVWYWHSLAQVLDSQSKFSESSKVWKQVCKMEPANEEFLLSYANALWSLGNAKELFKVMDQIENLVGVTEPITQAKVEIFLYKNDVKGAVGVYDKLIKKYPNNADYYVGAADIYMSNNMSSQAIPYLEKAAQLDANNGNVQQVLAYYYKNTGNEQAAFEASKAAMLSPDVELDKKLSILRVYLAPLSTSDPTDEQLQLATALLTANPEAVEGWASRASILLRQKKYQEAVSDFETALSIDPSQYALWKDFMYCLARAKNYARIIELEKDIVEIFPTNGMMNYTLGSAYMNTGKPDKAIPYFEKALKYTYDKEEQRHINNSLAEAYEAIGNSEKAAEYRQKGTKN